MKDHVSIQGSGPNATTLIGTSARSGISAESAIITTAEDSSIGGLKLENIGGGLQSIGIYIERFTSSSAIESIEIEVSGANSSSVGIFDDGALIATRIHNIDISVIGGRAGTRNSGILVVSGNGNYSDVSINIRGGTGSENIGFNSGGADSTMKLPAASKIYSVASHGKFNPRTRFNSMLTALCTLIYC